ncbi:MULTISPECIES: hypothetical protein [Cupriavidus]|uniref:hypothetical protein n=1 Tax=Cupriavidus TaxID=106589 RepID=UPI0004536824|nr:MULTISPECIES: hypothetical protein [Cupriavidus]KDP85114.1 hypothetical protein CF70_015600 [Cupriavidus sp. SK-3]MDF3886079.1 hypothetical protein [Cupriavidus basilensis]
MKALARGWLPCLPGVLLALAALFRPWLEATMARHMGLELPLLALLGWWAARCAGRRLTDWLAPWNAAGLPGLLAAWCIASYWMLPVALDEATLAAPAGMAKVAGMVLAGLLARASWQAAGPVLQGFFVINGVWMMLTAGLLYQEADAQLCSTYLIDEQLVAGRALVLWALALLAVWLFAIASRLAVDPEPAA